MEENSQEFFLKLSNKLSNCFCRFPEIRVAYLFGSQASGEAGRMSDLDIAVLLPDHLTYNHLTKDSQVITDNSQAMADNSKAMANDSQAMANNSQAMANDSYTKSAKSENCQADSTYPKSEISQDYTESLAKLSHKLPELKLEILGDLIELGYDNVDLAILNNMSILGQYEVVKHNKIIYQREDFDPHSYFSLIIRKYLDFKPYLKVQRKYLKKRILNG